MAFYGTQSLSNSTESIATSIGIDALDLFIYDTSKDIDGGAWRFKTNQTSWYNESLNTTIRGSRQEFPQTVLIASNQDTVYVYDADDPLFPMWMVIPSYRTFSASISNNINYAIVANAGDYPESVAAANAKIYIASHGVGVMEIDLFEDTCGRYRGFGGSPTDGYFISGNISERNGSLVTGGNIINLGGKYGFGYGSGGRVRGAQINDIDVCVPASSIPNSRTGLCRPRLVLASDEMITVFPENVEPSEHTDVVSIQPEDVYSDRHSDAVSFDSSGNLAFHTSQTTNGYQNVIFFSDKKIPGTHVSASYSTMSEGRSLRWDGKINVADRSTTSQGFLGYWAKSNSNRVIKDVILTKRLLAVASNDSVTGGVCLVDKSDLISGDRNVLNCRMGADVNTGWVAGYDKAIIAPWGTAGGTLGSTLTDYSVENRDFTVTGTINVINAVTNSELKAFSGFSSGNTIIRAYDAADNPGTNDYTMMGWFKKDAGNYNGEFMMIIAQGLAGTHPLRYLGLKGVSTTITAIGFGTEDINGHTMDVATTDMGDVADGKWHHACVVVHHSSTCIIYVDGVCIRSDSVSAITDEVTFAAAADQAGIEIGSMSNGAQYNYGTNGAITLAKLMDNCALTPDQVKKVFDDEKKFFVANNLGTLSNNSFEKLAYDEITDRLYISSSNHVDEVVNISVINKESGGGNNALDAHGELVVKED